jgi:DNA polymerase/3'-5' exonuclease PolX
VSENLDVARALREIADLLDLLGERFKPAAYQRASRSIESLTEDIAEVARRDQLRAVPGVGEAIEEKVREFLRTGSIDYLVKLRADVPPGVLELVHIPGVGPKTARRFWTDLGVQNPAELRAAIDAGRLVGMTGFGPVKIAKIHAALDQAAVAGRRRPILEAALVAERIVAALRERAPVDQVEVAGSFRRRRETVGDLDILVTSAEPEKVFDLFETLEGATVALRGPTKETIRTSEGWQVDLRVVAAESFGAALQYFTGSKDHNVATRSLARDRGLKINEYAVMRGEERLPSATEADIYRSLDLPWIPPEIREAQGEIEAARSGRLPALLQPTDLLGELHLHVAPQVDAAALDRMAESAHKAGLRYIGLVPESDAEADRLGAWAAKRSSPRVLVGREVKFGDPVPSSPAAPAFVLWSAVGAEPPSPDTAVRPRGPPGWLGHLGGDPESAAGPRRLSAWVDWATAAKMPLEVTSGAGYDGLDAVSLRRFTGAGGHVVVSEMGCGAERGRALAVGTARRAWVTKASVLNAAEWP